MTREEQLKEYLKERNIPINSLEANSIIEGIEWTDEHPKEGMVSLDKVCEWLEEHMVDFCSECAEQALISWLRKAMEE